MPELKDYTHRLLWVKVIFIFVFIGAAVRLVQIQILDASKYQDIAKKQYEVRVPLHAQRGNIYDRNGNLLVSNSQFVSFSANPKFSGQYARKIAERFSKITGKPIKEYLEKLQSSKRYVVLEKAMRPDEAEKIPVDSLVGVVKSNEPVRLYHYNERLGQVLGTINAEYVGVSGIEQQFDKELRGVDGYVVLQKDGKNRARPSTDYPREDPVNGNSLELTIDLTYQSIAEEELKRGIQRTQAEAGLVVILQPQTGEILALANYPPVNLNEIKSVDLLRNRVVSDMYEPGSVFKIVTASAALQNNVTTLDKKFYAENGSYKVQLAGNKMRTISDTHPMKDITFMEAMAYSSNIVMAKVSNLIGPENLYNEARNFGFGMTTGIELPAEINGQLKKPVEWSGTTLNTIAYGYEVGVTPLQIAAAYAAIANDGMLMKPYIVKREIDPLGNEVFVHEPTKIRRVTSRETAQQVKTMLESVVEFGTGGVVKLPTVTIAGKTGTSRKYVDGKYESGSYNASFVGFFPAEKPELVCLVMTEKPKVGYTGAVASAPIFKAITERIINNNGLIAKTVTTPLQETTNKEDKSIEVVPDICGRTVNDAVRILQQHGFQTKIYGKGDEVMRQYPAAESIVERGTYINIMMDEETPLLAGMQKVPDVHGMSVRRASNNLAANHLGVTIIGSGVVVNQFPGSGTAVKVGARVTIMCEPKALTAAQLY
ncbi:MAG: PASTA domain-containing protein [Bacteroidetes bacterium]|nr:PASTA domain-containing protein [Bacteroidota bacterium]